MVKRVVVLVHSAEAHSVYKVAERLRKRMENLQSDNLPRVTISIGIAFYPEDNEDIQNI